MASSWTFFNPLSPGIFLRSCCTASCQETHNVGPKGHDLFQNCTFFTFAIYIYSPPHASFRANSCFCTADIVTLKQQLHLLFIFGQLATVNEVMSREDISLVSSKQSNVSELDFLQQVGELKGTLCQFQYNRSLRVIWLNRECACKIVCPKILDSNKKQCAEVFAPPRVCVM